jgi:hypothetical protein
MITLTNESINHDKKNGHPPYFTFKICTQPKI